MTARILAAGIVALAMLVWTTAHAEPDARAYDFSFDRLDGAGRIALEAYRGKALLIVNTASFCGFTNQYSGLQAVWDRYRDEGLVVVGVPSGDFGGQEYAGSDEIKSFCEVNFGISFPLTAKVHVRGGDAHPFYRWAARTLGPGQVPDWNFHKYLIDRNGRLIAAFDSHIAPQSKAVTGAIEAALAGKDLTARPALWGSAG